MAVFATLWNGLGALSAWQTGATLALEGQNLLAVENLPLGLDPTTQAFISNRIVACLSAADGISALPPPINLFNVSAPLAAGQPIIADPRFLEWCMNFTGEVAPAGSALPSGAAAAAHAWLSVINAIRVLQGNIFIPAYDTATRQYRCASVIADILTNLLSGPFAAGSSFSILYLTDQDGNLVTDSLGNPIPITGQTIDPSIWSGVVGLPTLLLDAGTLNATPSSLLSQQISVIRYALLHQLVNLANLLLSFRSKSVSQPSTGVLRNAESLMDFAARTTGNFENWSDIAALNNIQPPYPGPTNLNIALEGKQLFTAGVPSGNNTKASYEVNVLGTDYDWGPINGPQPPWLGDISLITGYFNFRQAIGRRLQTPLGGLIYHTDYGCSIPAEIGAIQSSDEAAKINEYGKSAIRGDPRTGSILSASTTLTPPFSAHFIAKLSPKGPGAQSVDVSQVIGAIPG